MEYHTALIQGMRWFLPVCPDMLLSLKKTQYRYTTTYVQYAKKYSYKYIRLFVNPETISGRIHKKLVTVFTPRDGYRGSYLSLHTLLNFVPCESILHSHKLIKETHVPCLCLALRGRRIGLCKSGKDGCGYPSPGENSLEPAFFLRQ